MITRTSLANEIDEYDQQIADMNTGKKDCFDAYRAQLVASGMVKANIKTEIEAVKAAIKRRRAAKKDPMAVEEKDALIDEIFEEITTSPRAPRATRENIEEFDPETGEIRDRGARRRQLMSEDMADHKTLIDEMADLGMISEEAREENKRLADAVATKFGNGPIKDTKSTAARNGRAGTEAVDTVSSGEGSLSREPIGPESLNDGTVSGQATASEYQASPVDRFSEMDRAAEGSFETGSEATEKGRKAIPGEPEGVDLNHAGAGEIPATNSNPVANVGEEFADESAASSDDPASRASEESERQRASMVGFADDCRTGGNEQVAAAPAPGGEADARSLPANSPETATEESAPSVDGCVTPTSLDRVSPQAISATTGSVGANTGGEHEVTGSALRAGQSHPSNNGEVRDLPNTTRLLRPHCQRPDMCGSGTKDHCWNCKRAIREGEAA